MRIILPPYYCNPAPPNPINANNIGEVIKPMKTKTHARIFRHIPFVFLLFIAKIVPIIAIMAAKGTNTIPKKRMPKTAKIQAIIAAVTQSLFFAIVHQSYFLLIFDFAPKTGSLANLK
ncbi:hypothetical protein [Gallibacterium anatis]|uniref:Uncharacterized protein n=2 Tax=Gallibacterium TaxID=155493 RepID=U1H1X3_9PAST|nr:hypothetical protein [Gallibacterium anatis]ERF78436.1 hypothetical protein N561_06290 [Gallibacterium anatis 12656/12]KGQ31597.1 hypothetical protein JP34_10510 [Gallibacterium anatis]